MRVSGVHVVRSTAPLFFCFCFVLAPVSNVRVVRSIVYVSGEHVVRSTAPVPVFIVHAPGSIVHLAFSSVHVSDICEIENRDGRKIEIC